MAPVSEPSGGVCTWRPVPTPTASSQAVFACLLWAPPIPSHPHCPSRDKQWGGRRGRACQVGRGQRWRCLGLPSPPELPQPGATPGLVLPASCVCCLDLHAPHPTPSSCLLRAGLPRGQGALLRASVPLCCSVTRTHTHEPHLHLHPPGGQSALVGEPTGTPGGPLPKVRLSMVSIVSAGSSSGGQQGRRGLWGCGRQARVGGLRCEQHPRVGCSGCSLWLWPGHEAEKCS